MGSGLGYGLAGLLGVLSGIAGGRKQAQEDALLEAKLRGHGTWEPISGSDDRSWLARTLGAGMPQGDIEVSPGHRYRYTPYRGATPDDLISAGLSTPMTTPAAQVPAWPEPGGYLPGSGFGGGGAPMTTTPRGDEDLLRSVQQFMVDKSGASQPMTTAYPSRQQEGLGPVDTAPPMLSRPASTKQVPIQALLGQKMTPEFVQMLAQQVLIANRERERNSVNTGLLTPPLASERDRALQGGPQPPAAPAAPLPQTPGGMTQTPLQPPAQPSASPPGPGSSALQDQTGLAQRSQQSGANPRTVLALLGTEDSGPSAVSPKGATGRFQIMPETARPYLPKAMQQWTADGIRAALKDEKLNESVGLRHIKDLQDIWPDNPQAVAAAYFSGVGNVRKDGSIINPTLSDGNLTVQQYVDRFQKRFAGQALVAGGAPGAPPTSPTTTPTQTATPTHPVFADPTLSVDAAIQKVTKGKADGDLVGDTMDDRLPVGSLNATEQQQLINFLKPYQVAAGTSTPQAPQPGTAQAPDAPAAPASPAPTAETTTTPAPTSPQARGLQQRLTALNRDLALANQDLAEIQQRKETPGITQATLTRLEGKAQQALLRRQDLRLRVTQAEDAMRKLEEKEADTAAKPGEILQETTAREQAKMSEGQSKAFDALKADKTLPDVPWYKLTPAQRDQVNKRADAMEAATPDKATAQQQARDKLFQEISDSLATMSPADPNYEKVMVAAKDRLAANKLTNRESWPTKVKDYFDQYEELRRPFKTPKEQLGYIDPDTLKRPTKLPDNKMDAGNRDLIHISDLDYKEMQSVRKMLTIMKDVEPMLAEAYGSGGYLEGTVQGQGWGDTVLNRLSGAAAGIKQKYGQLQAKMSELDGLMRSLPIVTERNIFGERGRTIVAYVTAGSQLFPHVSPSLKNPLPDTKETAYAKWAETSHILEGQLRDALPGIEERNPAPSADAIEARLRALEPRGKGTPGAPSQAPRTTTPPAAAQPANREKQLPAAADYTEVTIRDKVTGKSYKSDGTTWEEVGP